MTHNNMLSCKQHEYEGKKQGMSRKRDQRELPSKLNVKLSDEIRFQNAGKRQIIPIISDFYVVNTSPCTVQDYRRRFAGPHNKIVSSLVRRRD